MAMVPPQIRLGQTHTVISQPTPTTGAGTQTQHFHVDSDSVLISLYADVVSGTLDVSLYTLTEEGKEVLVTSFPTLSAPTGELLLKKAAIVMSRLKIVATYSDVCSFEVRARGINAGETSVKILGAANARASTKSVPATPTVLIAASLSDRSGLIVKNTSTTSTLYIGFSISQADPAVGYPLTPGESMGMDIQGGAELYGQSSSGSIDVRILEAGS